jgi:hypothetical protein
MRYRLRTLLIVLAIGPPALALLLPTLFPWLSPRESPLFIPMEVLDLGNAKRGTSGTAQFPVTNRSGRKLRVTYIPGMGHHSLSPAEVQFVLKPGETKDLDVRWSTSSRRDRLGSNEILGAEWYATDDPSQPWFELSVRGKRW